MSESHYHSKKDRVFVRAVQGDYGLKQELARLRAQPRVRAYASLLRYTSASDVGRVAVALAALAIVGLMALGRLEGDDTIVALGKGIAPRRRSRTPIPTRRKSP